MDDEPDVIEFFKAALELHGYGVDAFTDPLAALAHIQKNSEQCDLVITDYRMPKMNGYEFSLKIKELNNNIKIILISAYDNSEGYKGEFELLKKPIPIQTLIDKVNENIK